MSQYRSRGPPKRHKSDSYTLNKKNFTLEPGLKGFICTCNFKEKKCIREAYNILNEYADRLFGMDSWRKPTSTNETKKEEPNDIDEELAKELSDLRQVSRLPPNARRFQIVDSQANNCLFIRTSVPDPLKLALAIVEDIETTQIQKTKFLIRLLPIEITCKANLNDITTCIKPILDKYFIEEPSTFSVVINCRNNSSIVKISIMTAIAEMVKDRNIHNKVDLKNPEKAILIEIIRGNCCIGILPNYYKYKKYNLIELAGISSQPVSRSKDANNEEKEILNDSKDHEQEGKIDKESDKEDSENAEGPKEIEKSIEVEEVENNT